MTSHFNRGWSDRMATLPPPETYLTGRRYNPAKPKHNTLARVQYERGRHVASLWLHEVDVTDGYGGTIHKGGGGYTFAQARKLMSHELHDLIENEEIYCSLKSELLMSRRLMGN